MRLILVRHGETDGQSSIRYYGATDVSLSEVGRAQMRCAARALAGERFAAVYSSALSRSREGACIVSERNDVQILPGFNEIDFGEWEGLTDTEIRSRSPETYARWHQRPGDFHYPGGESTAAFRQRGVAALHTLLPRAPRGSLLFVLHKGVIRTIVSELLQLGADQDVAFQIDLASIHILAHANGVWRAEVLNRVDHLAALDSAG